MTGSIQLSDTVKAGKSTELPLKNLEKRLTDRLQLLYELPLQFVAERGIQSLYDLILERVVGILDGARRGTLLVLDTGTGKLALRAAIPREDPALSRTLVQRAVSEQGGFIWSAAREGEVSQSVKRFSIQTGMYVALMWQGNVLGVLGVDNPERTSAFEESDLRFLMAVGHYAAAAIANQMLRQDLESNNRTMEHLLASFSPRLRGLLLEHARAGRLRPGGTKSQVTILMADLRGFTRTMVEQGTDAVVDMLNEYFAALVETIFKFDGTVDKFLGDAVLVVFGSPEPDPGQHEKAVGAALEMLEVMATINHRRRASGRAACDLGVGLHCGEVLHGFIGAAERMEFTVIGDAVNVASRLCGAALANQILASRELVGKLSPTVEPAGVTFEPVPIQTKHRDVNEAFLVHRRVAGRH